MKKIADKYKNDMEKRTQAQRELFSKHNYNPFAGCLVMFIQLPIFIGLYRGLSVDIELRQAPLIPGLSWCSNLAGPDMFLDWSNTLPSALSSPTGWLGPYLNILPLVTCVLFMVHQKLFTPPPTDDQQRMQQQIMKFMMLFMAVLFHKVAAGLAFTLSLRVSGVFASASCCPRRLLRAETATHKHLPQRHLAEAKEEDGPKKRLHDQAETMPSRIGRERNGTTTRGAKSARRIESVTTTSKNNFARACLMSTVATTIAQCYGAGTVSRTL